MCGVNLYEQGIKIVHSNEFWEALKIYLLSNKSILDTDRILVCSIETYSRDEYSMKNDGLKIGIVNRLHREPVIHL